MITRRDLIKACTATAFLPTLACTSTDPKNSTGSTHKTRVANSPCDDVDCFIGTGGHGHTYPGATTPFGMVQLSPDTSNNGWDSCSGYHQRDGSIMGFSHTHLSGTGCADMLDVLVVPRTGELKLHPGSLENPDEGYRSRYNRNTESASPGYYSVELTDSRIKAELTASKRAGLHRYNFRGAKEGHLLVDLAHGQKDWWTDQVDTRIKNAQLRLIGNNTLVGARQVFQWARGRWIFFVLRTSRPFSKAVLFNNDKEVINGTETLGENLKCALHFDDAGDAPLLVKVGISSVDIEGALKNLDSEIPDFDFERVRNEARLAWHNALSGIQLETKNEVQRKIFQTAHYHSLLAPTLFSDVDRRYRGSDNEIHTLKPGEENYSTYSLWDTYRALHPFFTITQCERLPAMIGSLVRIGLQSPAGAPIWPLQGRETDTMIGYHSASVLAEACVKQVPGVDYSAAYSVIRKRAFEDDVHGFDVYRKKGYIPADRVDEAVSRTLEFAHSDWGASKLAEAAGQPDEAQTLRARSQNYRNVFDTRIGFVRGRLDDKSWASPFSPDSLGHNQQRWRDFTECNAWQATFLNQHDIYNYMALFGGEDAFEAKLDALSAASPEMTDGSLSDISGLVGQYAHGNEPSHHIAYLYAYCGAHYKTQARVRMLCDTMYRAAHDGLAGNEDCGQMSAWYLMSAIGIYPVDPISGVYVFGSPLFPTVSLSVGNNKRFIIETNNTDPAAIYIQETYLNREAYTKSYISHKDIMRGGVLKFVMGRAPNKKFGFDPVDRPPSFV
ncbi:MAG: GH92 family glycosyl hydrolase [Exilibacterium sp.]